MYITRASTRGDHWKFDAFTTTFIMKLLNVLFSYLIPFLVLLVAWLPIINYYYVPSIVITNEMVDRARSTPDDMVLNDLKGLSLGKELAWDDDELLIIIAEKILKGDVEIPELPYIRIGIPFDKGDIEKVKPSWQLSLAGFIIPKVLLRAYQINKRDNFLMTARDIILAWASYERSVWFPRGFFWNDHAIAARIMVLAEFWSLYRNHPGYEREVAKELFQFVARSGQFLAKPSHFTFSTNHGVMQNLGLWHLCLAFPTLPDAEKYKELGLKRMVEQMTYYINNEGIVLEHSAGYQGFGMKLIGMALRYLTIMHIPIPEDWQKKYERAQDFYAHLRRPDGSLPRFGDTNLSSDGLGPRVTNVDTDGRSEKLDYQGSWAPERSNSLYPVAGYAIWWYGLDDWPHVQKLSQTAVTWSYFPGHGHKHADEMSILLWAGGQTWWTNVGYWPYGARERLEAKSWRGSNAPHLLNESTDSVRKTNLQAYGWSDDLAVIDLQRRGPAEFVARRQVIHVKPNLWLVVDATSGDERGQTTTIWTTSPDVNMSAGEIPGFYELESINSDAALTAFLFGSPGMAIKQVRGSFMPFAGWEVIGSPKPTAAMVVEHPSTNAWGIAIWSLKSTSGPTLQFAGQPYMQHWESTDRWKVVLPTASNMISIGRESGEVYVNYSPEVENSKKITLIKGTEVFDEDEFNKIRMGYKNAANKYTDFKYSLGSRVKITYCLVIVFVIQESFFLFFKNVNRKHYIKLKALNVFCWIAGGMWLVLML